MNRSRVAVIISGRGSNLLALLQAAADPAFPAGIDLVISNRPQAAGLMFAKQFNIPAQVIDHTNFPDKALFEATLHDALITAHIEWICLAGFMRILSAPFIEKWRGRILNIHPSLLPAFPGLHVHEQALAAGVKFSGCTVHYVEAGVDTGKIIDQAVVPVLPHDTAESLAARVLEAEHMLYPAALAQIISLANAHQV